MNLTKEQIFGLYNKSDYVLNGKKYPYQERQGIIEDCLIITTIMGEPEQVKISDCKLILRTFEDMTEEEDYKRQSFQRSMGKICGYYTIGEFEYLISIGIDVFGAIEKGWAIKESGITQ